MKYALSVVAATGVLLVSYHYLVRFTFIGAVLNGRKQRGAAVRTMDGPAPAKLPYRL